MVDDWVEYAATLDSSLINDPSVRQIIYDINNQSERKNEVIDLLYRGDDVEITSTKKPIYDDLINLGMIVVIHVLFLFILVVRLLFTVVFFFIIIIYRGVTNWGVSSFHS